MTIIEDLEYAGLSGYEARAYYTLLSTGNQTGREVSRLSKVPPTRVFDVLKQLEGKGLIQCIRQRPMIWRTIKPDVNLKAFIDKKVTRYKELERHLFDEIKNLKPEPEEETYDKVNTVAGFGEAFSTITSYVKRARKSVRIYSVGESIPSTTEIEIARAVKRGVDLRFIATKYDDNNKNILSGWIRDGWIIRHLKGSEEYTFLVVDRSNCMIVVKNPKVKKDRILIAFDNKGLSTALYEYFDVLWKKAKPI